MVNIKDYEFKPSKGDKLIQIFNRQKELMEKYHLIEDRNGLLITKDVPVDLHDKKGQARLKDFAWRVTEELGEALEAYEEHPDLEDHYNEEIADALHFLVEFTVLSGLTAEKLITSEVKDYVEKYANPLVVEDDLLMILYEYCLANITLEDIGTRGYKLVFYTGLVVKDLAMTCNTLKNKPWKQTNMLTDINEFDRRLTLTWISFVKLCLCASIGPDILFNLYFRKSEVNKFRIRSQY